MTTFELKNVLIHKISEIDDISFLKAIKTILDTKTEHKILSLTQDQIDEIVTSKNEIEKGLYIDSKDLEKEIKEWGNIR